MKAQRSPGGTRRGLDGKDRLRRRRARKSASSSGGPSMLKHAPSTKRSSASTTLDINSDECVMAASLRICVAATNSEHVEERQRPISAMRTSSIVHVALKVAARKQYHEQRHRRERLQLMAHDSRSSGHCGEGGSCVSPTVKVPPCYRKSSTPVIKNR